LDTFKGFASHKRLPGEIYTEHGAGHVSKIVLWGGSRDTTLQKSVLVRQNLTESHQNHTGRTGAECCPALPHQPCLGKSVLVILAIMRINLVLEVDLHFVGDKVSFSKHKSQGHKELQNLKIKIHLIALW